MKIKDAVVLVTGANRGLGRALVLATLKRGAKRVYAGARDPKTLEELVRTAPGIVVPLALDITDARSVEAAAAQAADVSMLVNNAGVLASYDILTSSREDIAQDFATNAFGMLATAKAFLPSLERATDGGRRAAAIVNVLSVVSLANMPGLGGYSASKAAAFSFTQALRASLAKKHVRVHGVLAGAIDTDMVRGMDMPKTSPEAVAKAILEGVEQDLEDIAPDPMSAELFALWRTNAKGLEQKLATMGA